MKDYVNRVVAELPHFMTHFSQTLFRPRRFINEQVQIAAQPDAVGKGVDFLIISFLIGLFISQVLPEATTIDRFAAEGPGYVKLVSTAVHDLFMLFFCAAISFASLRLFGVAGSFFAFFRIFAFFAGTVIVLMVFGDALTNIAVLDPVVGKGWIALERNAAATKPLIEQALCATDANGEIKPDPALAARMAPLLAQGQAIFAQISARPLFVLATRLQTGVAIVILGWLLIAWVAYGRSQQLGLARIIASAAISVALIFVGSQLLTLVTAGNDMMSVYRACAA